LFNIKDESIHLRADQRSNTFWLGFEAMCYPGCSSVLKSAVVF